MGGRLVLAGFWLKHNLSTQNDYVGISTSETHRNRLYLEVCSRISKKMEEKRRGPFERGIPR